MISYEAFERIVEEAIGELPEVLRSRLENVAIVVEEEPPQELCGQIGIRVASSLLGLYQGIPISRRGIDYGNVLPDKISLYRRNIEACCSSKKELRKRIKEVLLHEIGHYFGLSEWNLHEIERNL